MRMADVNDVMHVSSGKATTASFLVDFAAEAPSLIILINSTHWSIQEMQKLIKMVSEWRGMEFGIGNDAFATEIWKTLPRFRIAEAFGSKDWPVKILHLAASCLLWISWRGSQLVSFVKGVVLSKWCLSSRNIPKNPTGTVLPAVIASAPLQLLAGQLQDTARTWTIALVGPTNCWPLWLVCQMVGLTLTPSPTFVESGWVKWKAAAVSWQQFQRNLTSHLMSTSLMLVMSTAGKTGLSVEISNGLMICWALWSSE